MNNINKHLYNELFIDKKVKCDPKVYAILYSYIWPCEKIFKDFLLSFDTSVKVKYAKNIFHYFNTFNDTILPDFFIDELISFQQYTLKKSTDYIPQDHLIHSINLYILGIYVFFNIEVFHRKILSEYNEKNHIENLKSFIKDWKMFSLYHDLGYVLEGAVNQDGILYNKESVEKYEYICGSLVYKHTVQSLAKLILNVYIINLSNKELKINKELIINSEWILNTKTINGLNLYEKLTNYQDFIQLEYIHSEEDFNYVSWLLHDTNYLTIYENKLGIPLAFSFNYEGYKKDVIYNSTLKSYNDLSNEINYIDFKLKNDDIVCKYYINNLKCKVKSMVSRRYKDEIFDYFDCIPSNIKNKISLASDPNAIDYIYTSIYKWLSERLSNYDPSRANTSKTPHEIATQKAIISTFEEKISNNISNIIKSDNSTEEKINTLITLFKEISPQKVDQKIRSFYIEDFGTAAPILHFYKTFYDSVNNHLNVPNSFINVQGNKIDFSPFVYDTKNKVANKIYLKLQEHSKKLNIDFESLKSYHTEYTLCDHGVVSAAILFQIIAFNENLLETAKENPMLCLSYHNKNTLNDLSTNRSILSYSKVIFSILLHNIYTKKSKSYGISYSQNIDINAFSYFAALMDALQRWGRPKQLDLAVVDLPKEHFLENDYDIVLSDYNINIICSTAFAGSMRNQINKLEEYLPGASYIVKLQEKEL